MLNTFNPDLTWSERAVRRQVMYWEMIDSVPVWLRDYKFPKMLNSPSTPAGGCAVSCCLFSYWSWPRQTKVTALSPLLSLCRGWPDQLLSTLQVSADNYIYCHTPQSRLHTTRPPSLLIPGSDWQTTSRSPQVSKSGWSGDIAPTESSHWNAFRIYLTSYCASLLLTVGGSLRKH